MRKKWIFFVLLLAGLIVGIDFLFRAPLLPQYCAFCNPNILKQQTFYEDELVLALYTHKPIVPGHCLVIPKRHVERFEQLTDEEITQMGRVIKKVNTAVVKVFDTSAYLLLQKNGPEAGQTVPHVHFHYIPRKAGDNSSLKFLVQMYIANAKGPISSEKMQEIVAELKGEINATTQ
jgi:histidine triad (HIT) family protein